MWKKFPNFSNYFGEGTFQIVEKKDGYFYVTFHGYDGIHGARGLARTKDFHQWEALQVIGRVGDFSNLNVPWNSDGEVGVGNASILKEGNMYYSLIEVMDKNQFCTPNQNWVFALTRSPNLDNPSWEQLPLGKSALVFNSQEKDIYGNSVECGIQYGTFFRDSDGTIYLVYSRWGNKPSKDKDLKSGVYLYKLVFKNENPSIVYTFREGPNHEYTLADTISTGGNFEAQLFNTVWLPSFINDGTFSLGFNGSNSYLRMPGKNTEFNFTKDFHIKLNIKIDDYPSDKPALIAGKMGSYWIDLQKKRKCMFLGYDKSWAI